MRGEQPLFSGPDGAPRSTVHSGASAAGAQAVDALMLLPGRLQTTRFAKESRWELALGRKRPGCR